MSLSLRRHNAKLKHVCVCGCGGSVFVSDGGDIVHTVRMAGMASVES